MEREVRFNKREVSSKIKVTIWFRQGWFLCMLEILRFKLPTRSQELTTRCTVLIVKEDLCKKSAPET